MEYRTLEITLQYAKHLFKVNLISKMDVYAAVSISGGDKKYRQKIKTPPDHDGGSNPSWEFPMKFTVDEAALQQNRLMLDFKLVCQRALGDKTIGEVHVPVKELFDSPAKGGAAAGKKFVSYQVRKPGGRPKGQLTFSYRFSGENNFSEAPPSVEKACGEPTVEYPVVEMEPSSVYPPPVAKVYTPPPFYGFPPPPPPPPPPPSAYLYPLPPPDYYGYPPPPGYGYSPAPAFMSNTFDMGLGAGLLIGGTGGLLMGDMIYWD